MKLWWLKRKHASSGQTLAEYAVCSMIIVTAVLVGLNGAPAAILQWFSNTIGFGGGGAMTAPPFGGG